VNHDLVAVVVLLEHIPFSLNGEIVEASSTMIIYFHLLRQKKILKQTELSFL